MASAALYFEPRTLGEAVEVLAGHERGGIVAGGTDLVVGARAGRLTLPDVLVAVHRIDELRRVEPGKEGSTRVGALVTHAYLESDPFIRERFTALADAAALVGSPATRYVGTLGGNLVNASPAMESGGPLLAYEASVELRSATGTRVLPLSAFLRGPGQTALQSGELLTHVLIPPFPRGSVGSAYIRLEYRRSMEIAVVGAAGLVVLDAEGVCTAARVALTAVAPTCIRAPEAEQALVGSTPSGELLEEAGARAAGAAKPIDDVRAPADYRRAMVPVVVRRTLELALERAREGGP